MGKQRMGKAANQETLRSGEREIKKSGSVEIGQSGTHYYYYYTMCSTIARDFCFDMVVHNNMHSAQSLILCIVPY